MCKINEYPIIYMKAAEELRYLGINPKTPGFEMLNVAIVIQKVEGHNYTGENGEEQLYNEIALSRTITVPSINPVKTERHPVKQWILESLKEQGIEDSPMTFVRGLAASL